LRGEVRDFQNQTTNLRNLQLEEFLEGTFLRVPPLAEQRRIAAAAEELLAEVAEDRDRLHRAKRALRKFRQTVLSAATEGRLTEGWRRMNPPSGALPLDPGACQVPEPLSLPELPDGWVLAPLQELIVSLQYGTSKKADKNLKD